VGQERSQYEDEIGRHYEVKVTIRGRNVSQKSLLVIFLKWMPTGICKGGHLPSWENVECYICFNYNILVRTKRTEIVTTDTFHRLKNVPNCGCGWGCLPQTRLEEITVLPQTPSSMKGIRFIAEKHWQSGQGKR